MGWQDYVKFKIRKILAETISEESKIEKLAQLVYDEIEDHSVPRESIDL